jgi:uncharacterized protein DUF6879
MSPRNITPGAPEWAALFSSFTDSAFRLETLQAYDVPAERDTFRRFAAGDSGSRPDMQDWCALIGESVDAGRSMSRVHVITEPLTTYIRYELGAYAPGSAAGEQILIVPVRDGRWPARIPHADFWLFDDSLLLSLGYNQAGQLTGGILIGSGEPLDDARRARDEAVRLSVPYADYLAGLQA